MQKSNDLFLTSSDSEKLNLFIKIVQIKIREVADTDRLAAYKSFKHPIDEVNLRQIANLLHRSYGSIYNTYLGIMTDMEEILDKKDPSMNEVFNVDPDKYHFYLVEKSHPYRFIMDCLIHEKCTSFEKFYTSEQSSKATVLRHLKPIRTVMKKFNLRLTYEPVRLIGEEKMIRLGLTALIWNATRGYKWPFERVARKGAIDFVKFALKEFGLPLPDPTTVEFYATFVAVNTISFTKGHSISNEDLSIMLLRYPYPNVVKYFREANGLELHSTPEEELLESAHYYLYITCMPTFLPQNNEMLDALSEKIKQYNPGVYRFVTAIIGAFPMDLQKAMNYSDERMQQFKNNFVSGVIASLVFKGNYVGMTSFYLNYQLSIEQLNQSELKHMTLDTVQHIALQDEYQIYKNDTIGVAEAFYDLISRPVILNQKENRVQVYIGMERFFLVKSDLIQMLESISYVDINEDIEKADLIVVGNEEHLPDSLNENAYKFQWIYDGLDGQYGELYSLIHEIWTKREKLKD